MSNDQKQAFFSRLISIHLSGFTYEKSEINSGIAVGRCVHGSCFGGL